MHHVHIIYIHRVPQCMSPRRNCDSPTPSPASECVPSTGTKAGGGGHIRLPGEGVEEPQFQRREKMLGTLSTLWYPYKNHEMEQ